MTEPQPNTNPKKQDPHSPAPKARATPPAAEPSDSALPLSETPAEPAAAEFPVLEKAEDLLVKLAKKEQDLVEREVKLDAKLKEVDRVAAEARLSGYGEMRVEESQRKKDIEAARALVKGSGFDPFPDEK